MEVISLHGRITSLNHVTSSISLTIPVTSFCVRKSNDPSNPGTILEKYRTLQDNGEVDSAIAFLQDNTNTILKYIELCHNRETDEPDYIQVFNSVDVLRNTVIKPFKDQMLMGRFTERSAPNYSSFFSKINPTQSIRQNDLTFAEKDANYKYSKPNDVRGIKNLWIIDDTIDKGCTIQIFLNRLLSIGLITDKTVIKVFILYNIERKDPGFKGLAKEELLRRYEQHSMIITNLSQHIKECLPQAQEVSIAVALAHESALEELLSIVPKELALNILVGIDLPTSVAALTMLKHEADGGRNLSAKIYYDPKRTFHPKVYMLKTPDGPIAFVGSANLTNAGMKDNIEICHKVTSPQDCHELERWFKGLFQVSYPINDQNLAQLNKALSANEKKPVSRPVIVLKKDATTSLDAIDFSDRYFKKEHHWAFREDLWLDNSLSANKERERAELRFMELHDLIYPKFQHHGLTNLFPNSEGNIISRHHQINVNAPRKLNGMWLSYGKSQSLIKKYQSFFTDKEEKALQTFIHHTRLQIRIELNSIGIWMLFGKENKGSLFDRDFFKKSMNDLGYRTKFFDLITSLSSEYWISVSDISKPCYEFLDADELHEFCKKDNLETYFIVGRDYEITDPEMSEANLPGETLTVFKQLFPLYEMMKHKL